MRVDFTPIRERTQKAIPFAAQYTLEDIRSAAIESVESMLNLIADLDDSDVTFVPMDPEANDPYAAPEEQNIGWTLAHLIVHVTASTEEYVSVASVISRGIDYPREPRLRYETHWKSLTTKLQCEQRLRESLRIRLGYLDAFPDVILDGRWERGERFLELFGEVDAKAAYLFGLNHEAGHHAQMLEVRRQALAARAEPEAAAG